jgi:hypothetical protein
MSRQVKSSGALSAYAFDKTKSYKWNTAGVLVESVGTPGINELTINGSASALRRIADIERNMSIMYTRAFTTDYQGSVAQLGTDPVSWNESEASFTSAAYNRADQAVNDAQNAQMTADSADITATDAFSKAIGNESYIMAWDQAGASNVADFGDIATNTAAIAVNTTSIANLLTNTDATSLNSLSEVVAAFQAADATVNGAITALSTAAATDRALIRAEFVAADVIVAQDAEAHAEQYCDDLVDEATDWQTPGNAVADLWAEVQSLVNTEFTLSVNVAALAATAADVIVAQNAEASTSSAAWAHADNAMQTANIADGASMINAGDIQFNANNISTNTADIAANAISIYDNASLIAANTAAISANGNASKTHFHSVPVDVTLDGGGSVETTYNFPELATAEHYVVYVNRMLLRASEYSVAGSNVVATSGVLAIGDEIEVVGFQ